MESRIGFATKLGGILAAAGSAVGLGNIWRFPMQAGQNGGSAFIVVYLLCVLIFGVPLLIAEFSIGRHARANTGDAFKILTPSSHWRWVGPLTVLVAFLIICYYHLVGGWVLFYSFDAITGTFVRLSQQVAAGQTDAFANNFIGYITNPYTPLLTMVLFMGLTHFIITRGVQKGIERSSRILMPALFIIMLMLVVFAWNMPGRSEGLSFLFHLDPSAITPSVVLAALAQCFYSLSLGMGLITYASYFKREDNLGKNAVSVASMDTLVAVLAGMIIFPAVFSVAGVQPTEGAGLVFIVLPDVFNSALSNTPFLGWLIPTLFYLLLLFAALTSCVFLHEVVTAFVAETFEWSRNKAATAVSLSAMALGAICSLSMGPLSWFTLGGLNIFDLFDTVTAKFMLPVTGMLTCLYVGWRLHLRKLWVELTSHGQVKVSWLVPFMICMRYICPIIIGIIMITQLLALFGIEVF